MKHPAITVVELHRLRSTARCAALALALAANAAYGTGNAGTNVISSWSEIAINTVNATGYPAVTPEESRTNFAIDMAAVHVAIYDAVNAIERRYQPYAVTPVAPTFGASMESAAGAATCRALAGLFPNRAPVYSVACASYVPPGIGNRSHLKGVAVGVEVADKILALRANDGRFTPVPPYVPTGQPGNFVTFPTTTTPVNFYAPFVKPFAVLSNAQFRAYGPPDLTSAQYTEDFNEIKAIGGAVSATRTPDQEELARFATESPATYTPRVIRQFVDRHSLAATARLQAMLWVTHNDSLLTCFDSKYYYNAWRPRTAIPAADTDGNPATVADPSWLPFQPTPNHPEYPAAHTCADGAIGWTLRFYYGTKYVDIDVDSTVTGTTRHYDNTDDYIHDIALARIYGGMHFRTATEHGAEIAKNVAKWVAKNYFQPVRR